MGSFGAISTYKVMILFITYLSIAILHPSEQYHFHYQELLLTAVMNEALHLPYLM